MKTPEDHILEEIHRTRQQIAERFGGNAAAVLEDAQKRQASSNRPLWKRKHSEETQPTNVEKDDSSRQK